MIKFGGPFVRRCQAEVRLIHDIYDIRIPLPFSCQTQTNVSSGHVVTIESRALASVSALLRKRATASVLFSSSCALISTSCQVGRQLKVDMTPQTPQPLVQISSQGFLLKLLKSHETCSRSPLTQVPSKKVCHVCQVLIRKVRKAK